MKIRYDDTMRSKDFGSIPVGKAFSWGALAVWYLRLNSGALNLTTLEITLDHTFEGVSAFNVADCTLTIHGQGNPA